MKKRILVLGAGLGGLELTTLLSQSLGDSVETTLIDRNDAFVFGFSKLDVMFGHATPECVRMPRRHSGARREGVVRLEPASPLVRRSGAAAGNSPYQLDGLRGLTA